MHDPVTTTDKGRVRGLRQYPLGKPVDTFYGIPFAKPPINELRFRHPQPMDPWRGIFNATRKPNSCMQDFDEQFGNFSGSTMWNPNTDVTEDCLYLSVWAPRVTPPFEDKTVMVWIYGGGFYSGSSMLDIYDPTYFVAVNDVIVVAMNYRVGPLGFLALAHPELPGNAGMYDQLLALDWVQRNIHFFGGNPRKVTIFGESAGSVSVSMHLLSPLSRGKFSRAIMQSGVANCDWAVLSIAEARRRALALVDILKCNATAPPAKIVSCLRELPSESFHKSEWTADPGIGNSIVQFPFVPIVDGSFLVENPDESLKRKNFKKTPIIIGSNGNEGTWFLLYLHQDHFRLKSESLISKIRFDLEMQALFKYYPQYPTELNSIAQRAVIFQYTNWKDQDDQVTNRHMIDQAVADRHFVCEINEFAYAYAKSGENVYSYSYTYRSSQSPWPLWMGTIHADEINYVLGEPLNPNKNYEHKEKIFSRKIMTYWTNFAKTGLVFLFLFLLITNIIFEH